MEKRQLDYLIPIQEMPKRSWAKGEYYRTNPLPEGLVGAWTFGDRDEVHTYIAQGFVYSPYILKYKTPTNPCGEIVIPTSDMNMLGRDPLDRLRDQLKAVQAKPSRKLCNEWEKFNKTFREVTLHQKKRKLRAVWSVEAAQDLKAFHGVDNEKEISEHIRKEEINYELKRLRKKMLQRHAKTPE